MTTINHTEYLGVVRDSLGSQCDAMISQATDRVNQLLGTPDGPEQLTQTFKLCDPLVATAYNDIKNFGQSLAGNFEGIVQYNRDNRAFEVSNR